MDIKKAFIDGSMMNVVTMEEYIRLKSYNDPDLLTDICIEKDGVLYPVYNNILYGKDTPYMISCEWGNIYKNGNNSTGFESNKVIDFTNISSSEEMIKKQDELHKAEMSVLLANSGEAFEPVIREEDSPALQLVKQCMANKRINVNNYKSRFDSPSGFSNTIRLLTDEDNHSISIQKMKLIGDKFDIDFKITASDAKNAPNPMREVITKEI